jgi:N-acetylglucosaminyldiphosphoundecaprenol N-acetyl-beta-D-mannosaminyltransferase
MNANSYPAPPKVDVLGVGISATSYTEVLAACERWIAQKSPDSPSRYICVTSVHGVMEARRNAEIRSILNRADIATPDGMPLVWALRSFGARLQQRVYGPDLMLRLCEQAERLGHRVFLYGGRPEVLSLLEDRLRARFPELRIAGSYSPPFRALSDEEEREVRRKIAESGPDLLFAGISTPKQERWMSAHGPCFPGVVMAGVGAAFDFHAGRVRQAPEWMRRNGLEWLFRLAMEPSRLWRRYLLVTPWFLPCWALQMAGAAMQSIARGGGSTRSYPVQRGSAGSMNTGA